MTDIAFNFQVAVNKRNYGSSSQLIDQALREGTIQELVLGLKEIEKAESLITLERRDHIFYYFGMWDIYFAVQIPSTSVLELLQKHAVGDNARTFMVGFIRDLVDTRDNRFDQFCVNIQTIRMLL